MTDNAKKKRKYISDNQKLMSEWHPVKNGGLTPDRVAAFSRGNAWWLCKKCKHEWDASIAGRSNGNECPFCAKIKGKKALIETLIKQKGSLETNKPEIAKQWHPTRNEGLTPADVTSGSKENVWWQCEKVKEHEWDARVYKRKIGHNCPYCSGQRVCADNCLQTVNPELARQWHPTKNDLTPDKVTAFSNEMVWWQCEAGDNHVWEARIADRSKGKGCPFCAGKRACADNCLQTLYPELAKQWHTTKNNKTPYDVTTGSDEKAWWVCEKGHDDWYATISSRVQGSGCPACSQELKTSFPEQAVYYYMKSIFSDALNRYKLNNKWEIDIFVPSLKLGVEYDGAYYHQGEKSKDIESKKEKYLSDKGIHLLRIKETKAKIDACYQEENIIYCHHMPTEEQLGDAAFACLAYIDANIIHITDSIDIDVQRDRAKIYEQFITSEKENSLLALYPNVAKEWHPTENLNVKPSMVKPGSDRIASWLCKKCNHVWKARIESRTRGAGCPNCDRLKRSISKKANKQLP